MSVTPRFQGTLSAEEVNEIASWLAEQLQTAPEPVRLFLALQQKCLTDGGDMRRRFVPSA